MVLAYIDCDAQVCMMMENTMEKVGIRISYFNLVNMRLANQRKVMHWYYQRCSCYDFWYCLFGGFLCHASR